MTESDILHEILVAVTAVPGVLAHRNNSGLLYAPNGARVRASVPGAPDIIGCYRGRWIGLEVKTPRGRQSAAQRNYQAAVERAGGVYALVRSPAEALEILEAIP